MLRSIQEYLKILGLDKGASKTDVKAAYHKLALQHHPDKSGTHATSETFTKITEAYEFLMAWDGPYDDPIFQQNEAWAEIFETLLSNFVQKMSKMNKKHAYTQHNMHVTTNYDINVEMQVTMDDLYTAKIKKLLVKVHGLDGHVQHEELYISLLNYKEQYRFVGKGDYLTNASRGDIVVNLKVKEDALVKIDRIVFPFDLFIDCPISLHDYYFRKYLALPYLNGEMIEFDMTPGKKCVRIPEKGLPYYNDGEQRRGDLYVHLNLVLPESIPIEAKQAILTYFE